MSTMTPAEIQAYQPDVKPAVDPLEQARTTMQGLGLWGPTQQMGRSWPIACVALEITQRCNLDCTLCYLSEHSEAVHDIPLEAVFRRIDLIYAHYGKGTDVQITGGDPTLRKKDELLAIVRKVRELGMRPTLMTNGIRARRPLLEALAEAGLVDVAFHVDTTQERKGYANEIELNAIRQDYIDRTKGLPLSVMFNTTVHKGNFDDIPALVAFFRQHADAIRTVSFQLQADTGRGVERKRAALITPASVSEKICQGAGIDLNFEGFTIGHPSCNRYALSLAANGTLTDFFDEPTLIARLQAATQGAVRWDRSQPLKTLTALVRCLLRQPQLMIAGLGLLSRKLWRIKHDLVAARGRVSTLSFVIHNFMDACDLESERIDGCIFKTITDDGPLSMCMHNAKRDDYILRPIAVADGKQFWHPLNGKLAASAQLTTTVHETAKCQERCTRSST